MKKYIHILTKCPVFSGISEDNLLAMLTCMDAQICRYSKNQPVLRAGDPARYMGIVLSGRVQSIRDAVCGSRSIIADFGPLQVFGTSFACSSIDVLPVSVIALADSEIMLIDCRRIMTTCSNTCAFHAKMISNLLMNVCERNVFFHQKLEIVTKRTTREKLLTFFDDFVQQSGSLRFSIPYNRQQLADYLGVSRCAMVTEMTRMKEDGLIDFSGNEFEILQTRQAK